MSEDEAIAWVGWIHLIHFDALGRFGYRTVFTFPASAQMPTQTLMDIDISKWGARCVVNVWTFEQSYLFYLKIFETSDVLAGIVWQIKMDDIRRRREEVCGQYSDE